VVEITPRDTPPPRKAAAFDKEGSGVEKGRQVVGLVEERPQQLLLSQPRHPRAAGGHTLA
jgi:hypothetical protein